MSEQLTLIEEAFGLTVVEGENLQLTLDGGNGPSGPAGAAGTAGVAGPNTITTSTTAPSLNGYIFGNGTTIAGATAAASAATPSTLVVRTSGGAASFTGITNNGLLTLSTGTTFSYGAGIAAAHRTALGLGTLATQSGTFSGTSSGTNTGDQDLSVLLPRLSQITVSGTTPTFPGPLVEQPSLINGKRWWAGTGSSIEFDGFDWLVHYFDGVDNYDASYNDPTDEPWKIAPATWNLVNGTGEPTLQIDPPTLVPVTPFTGTIALAADQYGRLSPTDMIGLGAYVSDALAVAVDTNGGFLTAGTGGTLPITRGGTGATTAVLARTELGSGATGDELFQALTPASARTILEINRTRVTQAADVSNATTTFVDTDLVLTLEGGVDYLIRGQFDMVSAAAGTGFKIQLSTSQNMNALVASGACVGAVFSSASASVVSLLTLQRSDFFNFTGLATRRVLAEFRLNLVATGTVMIRFAQNAGSTAPASLFKAGSFWTSERL